MKPTSRPLLYQDPDCLLDILFGPCHEPIVQEPAIEFEGWHNLINVLNQRMETQSEEEGREGVPLMETYCAADGLISKDEISSNPLTAGYPAAYFWEVGQHLLVGHPPAGHV